MERTPNKSRLKKLTLEKKILPPLLPGIELATFRSRDWRCVNKLSRLGLIGNNVLSISQGHFRSQKGTGKSEQSTSQTTKMYRIHYTRTVRDRPINQTVGARASTHTHALHIHTTHTHTPMHTHTHIYTHTQHAQTHNTHTCTHTHTHTHTGRHTHTHTHTHTHPHPHTHTK